MVDVGRWQPLTRLIDRDTGDRRIVLQLIQHVVAFEIGVRIGRMRDLKCQPRQREAGILGGRPDPEHRHIKRRTIGVEPEIGAAQRDPGMIEAQRPKSHVMALARTVADRLLKSPVLTAAEQIERTERRRRIRLVEHESFGHAQAARHAELVGNRPAALGEGCVQLRDGADQHQIDRIARKSVAGRRIARHPLALQNLQAHANGPWQDQIGGYAVGHRHRHDPGQSVVGGVEDDEDDQPDAEDAQRRDNRPLNHAFEPTDHLSVLPGSRIALTHTAFIDDGTGIDLDLAPQLREPFFVTDELAIARGDIVS